MSYCWSFSEIFVPVRNIIAYKVGKKKWSKIFLCPECNSFWVGLIVSFFINPVLPYISAFNVLFISNIFCGLIVFLICSILYKRQILY